MCEPRRKKGCSARLSVMARLAGARNANPQSGRHFAVEVMNHCLTAPAGEQHMAAIKSIMSRDVVI